MPELVITEAESGVIWRISSDLLPIASGQASSIPQALAAALPALLGGSAADEAAGRAAQLLTDAAADRLTDADAGRILRQALAGEAGPLVAAALAVSGVRLSPIAPPPGWLDDFFRRQIAKQKPDV